MATASEVARVLAERKQRRVTPMEAEAAEEFKVPGFLRLPFEIRLQIYRHLLPYTDLMWTIYGRRAWVWNRGSVAILALNRQIAAEAAAVMYGEAHFVVEVGFDSILFRPRLVLKTGQTSPVTPPFLDTVRPENIKRVRNIMISVQHVDSYTGMIKYNYSGDGLTEGLRSQVQTLVDALSTAPRLHKIRVHIDGGNSDHKAAKRVLEPFAQLCNVVGGAMVDGGAAEPFHQQLEAAMLSKEITVI